MCREFFDTRPLQVMLLTCMIGCGGPRKADVYPVAGTLTVSGQPAANAMIAFHPLGKAGSQAALPVANTGRDGTYRLTTYGAGDGAPAGEYAVTIVWPDDSEPHDECEDVVLHDRFKGRFADPANSSLRVTVGRGANDVPLRLRDE